MMENKFTELCTWMGEKKTIVYGQVVVNLGEAMHGRYFGYVTSPISSHTFICKSSIEAANKVRVVLNELYQGGHLN